MKSARSGPSANSCRHLNSFLSCQDETMHKPFPSRLFLTIATVISLSACSPVAYNRDEAVKIPPQATVAFAGGKWEKLENQDPSVDDDSVHLRIQSAITNQLQANGFTLTKSENTADFLVRYFIGLRREPTPAVPASGNLSRVTPAARPGWGWGWSGNTVTSITPQDFSTDSLVVELVERSTGQLAWRAVWRGEAGMQAPTQAEMDYKMSQLFRSAPISGN